MPMPEPPKDLVPAEVHVHFDIPGRKDDRMTEWFFYDKDNEDHEADAYVQAVQWLDKLKSGQYTIEVTQWTEAKR